jgi:hypothetical protein
MRIVLSGPGNIDYHFNELLQIPKEKVDKHIVNITKCLLDDELVLLPDKGISLEIAKKYKELKGKKLIATVPENDLDFGVKHLQLYLDLGIFDERINTKDWFRQDSTLLLYGDIFFLLGKSLGSMQELFEGVYLYKLFKGYKSEINIIPEKISNSAIVGNNIPLTIFIYKPFVKDKLSFEIEEYIKKAEGQIFYIENAEELKDKLKELKK